MQLQFFNNPNGQPAGITLTKAPYLHEGLSLNIIGNKGSGKSHTLAVLAEEAHRNQIPFIFFDVNGDAASLRQLGQDVIVLGRPNQTDPIRKPHFPILQAQAQPQRFIEYVLEEGFSLVVDMSGLGAEDQYATFNALAHTHFHLAQTLREPVMVLIDEAHRFAPQSRPETGQQDTLRMMVKLMSDGRKRGIILVTATQRSQYINKDVIALANVRMFGKCTWFPDYKNMQTYLPPGASFNNMKQLRKGQYYLVGERGYGLVQVKGRRTQDLGKTPAFRKRDRQRPDLNDLQMALPITIKQFGGHSE